MSAECPSAGDDGGDGCTILRMCLMLRDDTLPVVKMVDFTSCILPLLKPTHARKPQRYESKGLETACVGDGKHYKKFKDTTQPERRCQPS